MPARLQIVRSIQELPLLPTKVGDVPVLQIMRLLAFSIYNTYVTTTVHKRVCFVTEMLNNSL